VDDMWNQLNEDFDENSLLIFHKI